MEEGLQLALPLRLQATVATRGSFLKLSVASFLLEIVAPEFGHLVASCPHQFSPRSHLPPAPDTQQKTRKQIHHQGL